ncbi:MAG: UvrD-helicase domain-containing protein, partial [Clostridia bacterium]
NNYNKLKSKNNLIDFNDLNRLMLRLLDNEKIRTELQEKYTHIFLDEYQDVSPLQDGLLSKVIGPNANVFMVGDVKQSIYGFRGASPEWFLSKYDQFKLDDSLGKAYDMNVNFRSSPIILNFINDIFSRLMTKQQADIDYLSDCMIDPKRTDIVDDKVKIMLVSESERSIASGLYSVRDHISVPTISTTEKESYLVLKIITDLIGTDFFDAKKNIVRKLTYKDIAILSRSEKDESARTLIDILKQNAVPLNINNKLVVDESEGIRLILSIMKCVVGIADDVDYLATFLSLTDLSIDDIILLRDKSKSLYDNLLSADDNNVVEGFKLIDQIREHSYVLTNKELIRYILDDKKLRYYILQKQEGQKELKLIEEFLSKLSPNEDNLNLTEFITIIESSVSKGADFETSDDNNSVTLQTIHKSKGLEYPVVILYNASKEFSYIREHDGINFNSQIGFGMDHFDTKNRVKSFSLTKYAIKLKNNEKGYKEELRLLYVALTRAKNKLFITGSYKAKDIENKSVSKTNYTNCILDCFIDGISDNHNEFTNCTIDLIDEDIEVINSKEQNLMKIEYIGEGFVYPNEYKFGITFKNSVTGLNSAKSEINSFNTKKWLTPEIQSESGEDKAIIGTHYHKALELLDLTNEYQVNTSFEDVDYDKVKKAHNVLSGLIKSGDRIKKEAEFMLYVPYRSIVESEVEDKVLVQGVVDLIIEHADSIDIVDYKFSSLPIRILKQKYSEQLSLYKLAVEKAYNKKVNNTYIYSINTGELY